MHINILNQLSAVRAGSSLRKEVGKRVRHSQGLAPSCGRLMTMLPAAEAGTQS